MRWWTALRRTCDGSLAMPRRARAGKIPFAILMLMSGLVAAYGQGKPEKVAAAGSGNSVYVGNAACSRCHLAIAREFAHASMGHSLTPITPDFLKTLPLPASYYDAKSGHHFDVYGEGG